MADQENNQFEHCVLCGKVTSFERNMHIDLRDYYIEGIGQLCRNCCRELEKENEASICKPCVNKKTSVGLKMMADQDSNQFERCVLCGKVTPIERNRHIDFRDNYMEGIGQLCRDCYHKLEKE